jgi:hypothetical protein
VKGDELMTVSEQTVSTGFGQGGPREVAADAHEPRAVEHLP